MDELTSYALYILDHAWRICTMVFTLCFAGFSCLTLFSIPFVVVVLCSIPFVVNEKAISCAGDVKIWG